MGGINATAYYQQRGVTKDSTLPKLLKAYFTPGPLPENGLFLSDGGECFTHLFNPTNFLSSVGTMPRKIVFVIDISGSMDGQKLNDAKASFAVMIDTLDERDTLIVQPFSSQGTEDLWGSSSGIDRCEGGGQTICPGTPYYGWYQFKSSIPRWY